MSQRAGVKLEQFGYNELGRGRSITVPKTGAVQDNYLLGAGDEVFLSLRGQENFEFRAAVDRNGQVVLPRLPPIAAAGRALGDFRHDVEASVRRSYVATSAFVSIGRVRQISVSVTGEVNIPGQRILTGLSTAADAIVLSGGVKKTGSLRNVRVLRNGRAYNIDLYNLLALHNSDQSLSLADGDRVIIPPLGQTVAIAGLVRQPGIYELPARAIGITARVLLAMAGGEEVRGTYRLSVQRIEPSGRLSLVRLENINQLVEDSEILRVELAADLADTQATLSGGTALAGKYPVVMGARLSDVLRSPGALGASPYTLFGILVRKDPRTLLRSLIAFTPAAVLSGAEDIPLQTDDILRPITVDESFLLSFVVKSYIDKLAQDQDRIRNPLETQRADAAAAAQASQSGGTGTSGNGQPAAITNAASSQAVLASAISPTNPFGLSSDARSSFSDQEDFSGVPPDVQRADIIGLLDVAAPGTLLAQRRQLIYEQSLLAANVGASAGSPQAIEASSELRY